MVQRRRGNLRTHCVWLLASLMVMHAQGGSVRAQGVAAQTFESSDPAGYRETVAEAVREFAAHNFEESRSLFARAHALYPNARTHRGLGLAEFELRNYGESIAQLQAALCSSVKPLTPELKADTERMLARANNFVGRVYLNAKPSVTKLVVDGLPVEVTPGEPLLLQVGDHVLELHAAGFVTEKRKLSVQGGEERTLTVVFAHSPIATQSESAQGRPWYKSPWLWASVGVVVAGAAAGTGYALTRPEKAHAYGGSADAVLTGP